MMRLFELLAKMHIYLVFTSAVRHHEMYLVTLTSCLFPQPAPRRRRSVTGAWLCSIPADGKRNAEVNTPDAKRANPRTHSPGCHIISAVSMLCLLLSHMIFNVPPDQPMGAQ